MLTRSDRITRDDLTGLTLKGNLGGAEAVIPLSEVERRHIKHCLDQLDWNLGLSAEKLGIHRNTLRAKIKEYNLQKS